MMKVNVHLAENILPPLATMTSISEIDRIIPRKMHRRGAVRARKRITLVILNEDMEHIIRITKSQDNSNALIDGVSGRIKHKIKKTREWIAWCGIRNFMCFNFRKDVS